MKPAIQSGVSPSTRLHFVIQWIRHVFLAIGILSLGYCGFALLEAKFYQAHQAQLFEQQLKDSTLAIANNSVREMSVHPALGAFVAQLAISRIGITATVLEGVDDQTLRRAVGHIPGTAPPGQHGNVAIAGHRDTFFRALRNIRQDDEITVTTVGSSDHYRVNSTRVVEPDNVHVLDDSGEDVLTLVTCYPFYFVGPAPKRFIVRAQRMPR